MSMTLCDAVHSGTVARRMNDLTVSRRAAHVIFISTINAYRRDIHVTGDKSISTCVARPSSVSS